MNVDFKALASEIAKLMDAKEPDEGTRNDGKIEGSIWARYSGTASSDKISQSDAEKVIAIDLREKGVDFVRGVLHGMGIEWQPKVTAEPAEVDESTLYKKMTKLFDRFKNDIKNDPGIIAEILITPPGIPSPRLITKGAQALAQEINSDSNLKKYISSHKDVVDKYAKGFAQGVAFGTVNAMPGGFAMGAATQMLARKIEITPEQKQILMGYLSKVGPIAGEMLITLPSPLATSIKLTEQLKNDLIALINNDDFEGVNRLLAQLGARPVDNDK